MKHHLTRIIGLGLAALMLAVPAAAQMEDMPPVQLPHEPIHIDLPSKPFRPIGIGESPWTDVSANDWCYPDILEAVELGLMHGVSDSRFAPGEDFTRAMLALTLYRMEGEPKVRFAPVFSDVEDGVYYSSAVTWAAGAGLVNGSGGRFDPDRSISRQEFAAVLWRYAQQKGYDVSAHGLILPDFTDRQEIADWAGEAMSWAYTRGILRGSQNRLNPEGRTTRAEAASILVRFQKLPKRVEIGKEYVKK